MQVPFSVAIENVIPLGMCCPQDLQMETARIENKETGDLWHTEKNGYEKNKVTKKFTSNYLV